MPSCEDVAQRNAIVVTVAHRTSDTMRCLRPDYGPLAQAGTSIDASRYAGRGARIESGADRQRVAVRCHCTEIDDKFITGRG